MDRSRATSIQFIAAFTARLDAAELCALGAVVHSQAARYVDDVLGVATAPVFAALDTAAWRDLLMLSLSVLSDEALRVVAEGASGLLQLRLEAAGVDVRGLAAAIVLSETAARNGGPN